MPEFLQVTIDFLSKSFLKILAAIAIFVIGYFIIKRIVKLIDRFFAKSNKLDQSVEKLLSKLIFGVLVFVLLIIVTGIIGLPSTSLITILGSLGLAASLAFQDSLKNLAGGIIIMVTRPFVTGNFIETDAASGTVKEIGLVHTLLQTPDNKRIYVPNNIMAAAVTVNYSLESVRRIDLLIPVPYLASSKIARETILAEIERDSRIFRDPAPFVKLWDLAPPYANIMARCHVNAADFFEVKTDLLENIKDALDAKGITVAKSLLDVNVTKET